MERRLGVDNGQRLESASGVDSRLGWIVDWGGSQTMGDSRLGVESGLWVDSDLGWMTDWGLIANWGWRANWGWIADWG